MIGPMVRRLGALTAALLGLVACRTPIAGERGSGETTAVAAASWLGDGAVPEQIGPGTKLFHYGAAGPLTGPAIARAYFDPANRAYAGARYHPVRTLAAGPDTWAVESHLVDGEGRLAGSALHMVRASARRVEWIASFGDDPSALDGDRRRRSTAPEAPSRVTAAVSDAHTPLVRRFLAAVDAGDAAALRAVLAPTVTTHDGVETAERSTDEHLTWERERLAAQRSPKTSLEVAASVADYAVVVTTTKAEGPHGIPLTVHGARVLRIVNGRIAEQWIYTNRHQVVPQIMSNLRVDGAKLRPASEDEIHGDLWGPWQPYCCHLEGPRRSCWVIDQRDMAACRTSLNMAIQCRRAMPCAGARCFCCQSAIEAACDTGEPPPAEDETPHEVRHRRGSVWSPY